MKIELVSMALTFSWTSCGSAVELVKYMMLLDRCLTKMTYYLFFFQKRIKKGVPDEGQGNLGKNLDQTSDRPIAPSLTEPTVCVKRCL